MDRISGLNHIIQALRKQLDRPSSKTAADRQPENKQTTDSSASSSLNLKQLEQRIVERVKAINDDGRDPRRKASYVFVESVLAWEFGEQMLKEPDFADIINKVNDAIRTNPAMSDKIDHLLLDMLNK